MEKIFLAGCSEKKSGVTLLCTQDFLDGRVVGYRKEEVFSCRFSVFGLFAGRFGELLDRSLKIVCDQWRLAWEVFWRTPDAVLLASYSEYLSPLWVWPHWFMARFFGITYAANLHDPVRDYVVGPAWWHQLSVRLAYLPLSVGVVHQRLQEPSPVPSHVHVVEAPVGVYDLKESPEDPDSIRAAWGVGRRVAPEDGRSQLGDREKEDDLTTKDTNTHERGEEVSTTDCTDGHGYFQKTQGDAQRTCAGAAFLNPSTSELARDVENASLTRSASGPSGARIAPGGMGSVGGNQLADSGEFLEGQSQAGSHMDSQKLQSIRAANDHSASGDMSIPNESAKISEICGKNPSAPATPAAPKVVFLAFGFIRDNKNLDLVIRALVDNPEAVLVVMGRVQSKKDKPLDFYRNLAKEMGADGRVKFFDGFVPDEKLASYFAAADVVVLTYDGTFHSQSGVLNVAARAKRLVLASAGESPLKDCVLRFRLGVFVEPDDLVALKGGMGKLINAKCEMRNVAGGEPDWEGYERFASWDVNVAKILEGVEEVRRNKLKRGSSEKLK